MSQTQLPISEWMTGDRVRRLFDALTRDGAEARFVGGCVRDGLLGRPVSDVDVATTAPPQVVMDLAKADGLKAIPTGIDHGTITIVVDGRGFEVTTLREDISTDGRHAVVAFTEDWQLDAARRDFTINAMSATLDGALHDYFGGAADLQDGEVRFVGDPDARITEDVLRLLRFYRIYAWYGRGAPNPAARAACRDQAAKLPGLSAERVREELLKILRAPDPAAVFQMMADDGVLAQSLPDAGQIGRLAALVPLEDAPDATRRLSALLNDDVDLTALAAALRLSNKDARRLVDMAAARGTVVLDADAHEWRRHLYRLGADLVRDGAFLAAAGQGALPVALAPLHAALDGWQPLTLPVTGADLVNAGVREGPQVGEIMRALDAWWVDEGFQPDRNALLGRAADILADMKKGEGT